MDIPDAPWIQEAERTGHYRFGYFNTAPGDGYEDEGLEQEEEDDGEL